MLNAVKDLIRKEDSLEMSCNVYHRGPYRRFDI